MSISTLVLDAALRICRGRRGWTFRPLEIVAALPNLNAASVRTHVMSRCCVNAPPHHSHRWPYFRRVRRGAYEILPALRKRRPQVRTDHFRTLDAPLDSDERGPDEPPVSVEIRESGGRYVANSPALPRKVEGPSVESVISGVMRLAEGRFGMPSKSPPRLAVEIRLRGLPRPGPPDPLVSAYVKDVDRTLIRENLRLSVEERLRKLQHWMEVMGAIRGVARRTGRKPR